MANLNDGSQTYHSFSGVDIHAVFGDTEFGELQMVSYKIDREKAPVYVMGSADPRTVARGKRLISGACVFVVFEQDSLLNAMNSREDLRPSLSKMENAAYEPGGMPAGGTRYTPQVIDGNDGFSMTEKTVSRLADQLLPFDITLVAASEYGHSSKMILRGVELMAEAGGMSIDDLVIEKQMSFIARQITGWQKIDTTRSV